MPEAQGKQERCPYSVRVLSNVPRGRVCRTPPRVIALSPSSTSFFSLSFQMSSSSWLGAVPISPGWISPGNRTPALQTSKPLHLDEHWLRHSKCRARHRVVQLFLKGVTRLARCTSTSAKQRWGALAALLQPNLQRAKLPAC